MDLATILKIMQIVGPATSAFKAIYEGVLPLLSGKDQYELKRQYEAARERSDALHDDIQREARSAPLAPDIPTPGDTLTC